MPFFLPTTANPRSNLSIFTKDASPASSVNHCFTPQWLSVKETRRVKKKKKTKKPIPKEKQQHISFHCKKPSDPNSCYFCPQGEETRRAVVKTNKQQQQRKKAEKKAESKFFEQWKTLRVTLRQTPLPQCPCLNHIHLSWGQKPVLCHHIQRTQIGKSKVAYIKQDETLGTRLHGEG